MYGGKHVSYVKLIPFLSQAVLPPLPSAFCGIPAMVKGFRGGMPETLLPAAGALSAQKQTGREARVCAEEFMHYTAPKFSELLRTQLRPLKQHAKGGGFVWTDTS